MVDSDNVESLETQLSNLRSGISDLGYQIDSYKTKTAAALGAGVFLLLLAALAAYDLAAGKGGVWLIVGITGEALTWLTSGLGITATILLMVGFRRVRQTDVETRARLESMERQYAELLERRDSGAGSGF
ncbi:MAG TPA: hypothetical protein VLG74_07730 [Blastocatellia bacterium]|nr:hypothetical protein [Blastocatellia bacterium]